MRPALRYPGGMLQAQRFRFGEFELDALTGELAGPRGRVHRLEPQPARVLAILVGRAGELVTREALQREVWPETHVDFDQGLNYCIRRIRAVLGDTADDPRFIETLPRRGYRFVVPVEAALPIEPAEPATPAEPGRHAARHRHLWLTGLLLVGALAVWWWSARDTAPLSPAIRVAVLPFHGADAPATAWEERLTEALVVNLTQVGGAGLAVIGPATTAPAAGQGIPQGELGGRLGADFVLSGGIRTDGQSVFAQLLGAPGGEHLWATVLPLGEPDVVGLEIVKEILVALQDKT